MIKSPARIVVHQPQLSRWPIGHQMRIAILSDLHACTRWMPLEAVEEAVAQTNAIGADLILLPGDFPGHLPFSRPLEPASVVNALAQLRAPLGVFAAMGNHDWKDDRSARKFRAASTKWHDALEGVGIPVLSNQNIRLKSGDMELALVGLESQRAFGKWRRAGRGADDVEQALDGIPAEMFTIMMAHEPDIFEILDRRVDLTVSGHTHGGQIRLFGRPWVVPSDYGKKYAYGMHSKDRGVLIVSGGLGCSGLPMRWNMPSELTVVEMS